MKRMGFPKYSLFLCIIEILHMLFKQQNILSFAMSTVYKNAVPYHDLCD